MRNYLEELRGQVAQHLQAGKSMDEIKQLITMEKYSSWGNYQPYLPLNIEGMVRHLQRQSNAR
jgi:cytochrome c-type biogenesis protein CcmH/NrfF